MNNATNFFKNTNSEENIMSNYILSEKNGYLELTGLSSFSAAKIFDCGQSFRFNSVDGGIEGVAFGRFLRFEQTEPHSLKIFGTNKNDFEQIWVRYLALDEDYSAVDGDIITRMNGDDTIKKAISCGSGIRILRQDGWEALCSFIISQNNNIPRIKKIIENMCREFGECIDGTHYSFPSAEILYKAGVDRIFELKTGFRAKYIFDAAEKVSKGQIDLSLIKNMTTQDALDYLMQIKGVGLKVASCTLLFGFNKTDAFPVDVWVKRVLEKYYPKGLDVTNLGPYAGLIQQYLFYYERYNQ